MTVSASIGFRVDRSVVVRNGFLDVIVMARNNSQFPVRAMQVKITQEALFRDDGTDTRNTKIISCTNVPGSRLGGIVQNVKGERSCQRERQSSAEAANAARRDIELALSTIPGIQREALANDASLDTWTGIITRVSVPGSSLDTVSLKGRDFKICVKHWLSVSLRMNEAGDAEVAMPLVVESMPRIPAVSAYPVLTSNI